jgi:dephospho-CoA kinase
MPHVFGLTGGIGSGKSTVAARFRERGLPVVDADLLAREAVEPATTGLGEIVREFGEGVLDPSGGLDRKRLAAIVFGDEAARRKLNAITHPRVRDLALARFAELDRAGEPLVCYEVPLLIESGLAEVLRPLVVVSVPEEVQVARTRARDGASEQEAIARVRAQMPLADKVALADHVIDNNGSLESSRARADEVLDAICRKFGVDPARYPRASG